MIWGQIGLKFHTNHQQRLHKSDGFIKVTQVNMAELKNNYILLDEFMQVMGESVHLGKTKFMKMILHL